MSARVKISGSIICQDEAAHIGACLAALHFCDEVVVVDSGSTDGTQDLVRSFKNARLLEHPFEDYIRQRNYALTHCQNEWVLAMDADEILTEALIDEIQLLDFEADGYSMRRRNFVGDRAIRFGAWNPDRKVRLFRKSKATWQGDNPHYTVALPGRVEALKARFHHLSYDDLGQFAERMQHYATLVARARRARGERAHPWDPISHGSATFLKGYLLRLGFLDGKAGWHIALNSAKAAALKYRLLREAR